MFRLIPPFIGTPEVFWLQPPWVEAVIHVFRPPRLGARLGGPRGDMFGWSRCAGWSVQTTTHAVLEICGRKVAWKMPVGPLVWCYLKTTVPAKASSKSIPKDSFSKISEGVDLFAGGGGEDFGTLKKIWEACPNEIVCIYGGFLMAGGKGTTKKESKVSTIYLG